MHAAFHSVKMVALNLDDRLLATYIFYGSILVLKTFLMSFLTGKQRIKNKVGQASRPACLLFGSLCVMHKFCYKTRSHASEKKEGHKGVSIRSQDCFHLQLVQIM